MSSERSASAITSEPKPGALALVSDFGRSTPATAGSAALVRAVADWGGVMGISLCFRLTGGFGRHPTGSGALTQPGEKSHSRIAVGRRNSALALKVLHRNHGRGADAAIGAAGIEAERGEMLLDFLDFRQRGGPFAVRKGLNERCT